MQSLIENQVTFLVNNGYLSIVEVFLEQFEPAAPQIMAMSDIQFMELQQRMILTLDIKVV